MRVLDRKLLRELRSSRSLLVTISSIMAVGVMCFVYMRSSYNNLRTAQAQYYAQCRMADFWIEVKKVPLADLAALYRGALPGRETSLVPLAFGYGDFSCWQRRHIHGTRLDAQLGYWRDRLAGAPPNLELPTDAPRPARPSHRGDMVWRQLEETPAVRKLCREHDVTPFMAMRRVSSRIGSMLGT